MIKKDNFTYSKDNDQVIEYFNDQGFYHRIDGPAVLYRNAFSNSYFYNGQRHRVDGPAIEWGIGTTNTKEWWYKGKQAYVFSQKEFEQWLLFRAFE